MDLADDPGACPAGVQTGTPALGAPIAAQNVYEIPRDKLPWPAHFASGLRNPCLRPRGGWLRAAARFGQRRGGGSRSGPAGVNFAVGAPAYHPLPLRLPWLRRSSFSAPRWNVIDCSKDDLHCRGAAEISVDHSPAGRRWIGGESPSRTDQLTLDCANYPGPSPRRSHPDPASDDYQLTSSSCCLNLRMARRR